MISLSTSHMIGQGSNPRQHEFDWVVNPFGDDDAYQFDGAFDYIFTQEMMIQVWRGKLIHIESTLFGEELKDNGDVKPKILLEAISDLFKT